MFRSRKLRFYLPIIGMLLLLSSPVIGTPQKVRITPSASAPMDISTTRSRTTFRQTGDSKRGINPFQQKDFTKQTKQITGQTQSSTSTMTPEIKSMVEALGNPLYMRTLESKKPGHTPSGRVPSLGTPRGANDISQRELPWTTDTLLANPTNMNDEYVSLAENPLNGHLYAVFAAKDLGGTDRDIHIAQSTDQGLTWTVNEMPAFSLDEYHPEIAVDAAGYVHVVWIREDGWILRSRTSAAGDISTWEWVLGLGTEETNATPSIAVSGSGDFATVFIAAGWLTVNWDLYQYEWTLIFMYSTNAGQTITYDYFNPDGYQDLWPDVAMESGLVHLLNAEVDYYSGETEILMATDTYNGSFGDLGYFTGYTTNNTGFPQIACQDENVYIVFQEDYTDGLVADGDIIYVYSWDAGETFYGPFGLIADEYESVGPSVFTRDGVVGVLWLDAPAGEDEFWLASRLGSGYGHTDFFSEVVTVSDEPRVEPMFHSCFGVAAPGLMHAAWIDRRDFATQGHNVYTSNRSVASNLAAFTPTGWDTCLVASNIRGGRQQGYLAAGDTTFISFAFLNDGLAAIEGSFQLNLKLDGLPLGQWTVESGLGTGTYLPMEDLPVIVSPGQHSLEFNLDTLNQIDETNEQDNQHTVSLTWIDGDPEMRLNPSHLTKTIMPEMPRSLALQLIDHPILKNETHLPVIDHPLAEAISNNRTEQTHRVMIVPAQQLNPAAMAEALQSATRATRREVITEAAKNHMERTFASLQPELNRLVRTGRGGQPQPLWLTGTIAMELTTDAITELSENPAIGWLWLDNQKSEPFGGLSVTYEGSSRPVAKANAWHIEHIGADQAWDMGLTGTGLLVGHLDTGIAYDHPDLAGHMWNGGTELPHHGWDSVSGDNDPYDGDLDWYHGTHTAGLIAGDGASGTTTGAAPGATLMALRAMPGYMDDMIEGLQFGLDNGVHLFSLSGGWAQGSDAVRSANRANAELLLSIDVPWICAAGNGDNYGGHFPVPTDIASPGDCPGPWFAPHGGATAVVSVGASMSNNTMWTYSSYGPTEWDLDNANGDTDYHDYPYTPGLMKPEITAPGGDVISCAGSSGYITYSGTSMATPLVTAAFCLIWNAAPSLLVPQVCELLETTAIDLTQYPCSAGRDQYSGAGLVNIPAALEHLPTAEPEYFWICNDGDLPLVLNGATWNSTWLEIILPNAAIAPGDSIQTVALIDPEGLPEGLYFDTAIFSSNDPGGPQNLPVHLVYGSGISSVEDETPLAQVSNLTNQPNPFNPRTVLKFQTTGQSQIALEIYDLRGRKIRTLVRRALPSGHHEVLWNGLDDSGLSVASGQYFARLQDGQAHPVIRKLLLVR